MSEKNKKNRKPQKPHSPFDLTRPTMIKRTLLALRIAFNGDFPSYAILEITSRDYLQNHRPDLLYLLDD